MNTLPANLSIAQARLPATYEAAKTALAECQRIDECQQWANKAEALASYAKQADDDMLYKFALRIQARAVRRAGELLKQFDARGAHMKRGRTPLSRTEAASAAGLSDDQRKQAVRVANVSEADFNGHSESDSPPTITALAELGTNHRLPPEGFSQATHLIGTVGRFAEFCAEHEPELVANGVMPSEAGEVRDLVTSIDGWLDRFIINLKDTA